MRPNFRIGVERCADVGFGGGDEGDDLLLVSRQGLAVDVGGDPLTDDFLGDAEVAVSGFLVLLARGEKACAADNGGGEHQKDAFHITADFNFHLSLAVGVLFVMIEIYLGSFEL